MGKVSGNEPVDDLTKIRQAVESAIRGGAETYETVAAFCGMSAEALRAFCAREAHPTLRTQYRLMAWMLNRTLGTEAEEERAREFRDAVLSLAPESARERATAFILSQVERGHVAMGTPVPGWVEQLRGELGPPMPGGRPRVLFEARDLYD